MVTRYLGESCERYRSLFVDSGDWTANSDQLSSTFELLLTDSIHTHPVPVGEALLTCIDEHSGTNQLFVPFCVLVNVSEGDNPDNSDSEDDRYVKKF